jgi:hypothetical protein
VVLRDEALDGTGGRVPEARPAPGAPVAATAPIEVNRPRPGRWSRWRPTLAVPLGLYLLTRLVQVALVGWLEAPGDSVRGHLLSWDSGWFLNVAQNGYPHGFTYSDGSITASGLAFFPLYPGLIRLGHLLGMDYGTSALAISWIAGAVAAVLLCALVRALAADGRLGPGVNPQAAGYAMVVLVCAQPMSVALSMGYTESLFIALVAGALLATYRRWWLLAGLLGLGAGLTRPTGAALAVAIAVAAAFRVFGRDTEVGERFAAGAAGFVSLISVPAYIFWVGERVGTPDAWFTIQTAGWGTTFDKGASTWHFIAGTLRTGDGWIAMSVVFMLIAATVALIVALVRPGWLPLKIYGLIGYVLVVGQAGFFHSKPRLFVPVLLLFVPAAVAAARARPRAATLWLAAYALFGLWYGAYMITVWSYAI